MSYESEGKKWNMNVTNIFSFFDFYITVDSLFHSNIPLSFIFRNYPFPILFLVLFYQNFQFSLWL